MIKITVIDRKSLKTYAPLKKAILFRVTSEYPFRYVDKDLYLNIFEFFFNDVSEGEEYCINYEEALNIREIIKMYGDNVDEMVFSCDFGKGRSPAMAKAASILLNQEFKTENYPDLNETVLNKIRS